MSRLFPGSFPDRGLRTLLPGSSARLSFPLDYWNGLGIFVGLAFPLLLRSTIADGRARRAAAFAVFPVLGAVVYLTSSRGAIAAIGGGALVFVLAQPRRWAALGAAAVAGGGIAAAVGLLSAHPALVDDARASAERADGHEVAVLILLVCVATAAAAEGGVALARRLPPPGQTVRRAGAAAIAAVLCLGAISEGWALRNFARLPATEAAPAGAGGSVVSDHLLSGSGSGRWQFWTAALDEFRRAPLHGGGAGSFEDWWAVHGSFRYFVRDAHSLFVETLGELGLVGFGLLVAALGAGLVVGARRLADADVTAKPPIAALLGAFVVFLIGAGIDWMWELTAVTVAGTAVLALLVGPATLAPSRAPGRASRRRPGVGSASPRWRRSRARSSSPRRSSCSSTSRCGRARPT